MPLADSRVEQSNALKKEEVRLFASAQFLCATAYLLPEAPHAQRLPILTEDGSYKVYEIVRIPLKEEMFTFILLPIDKTSKEVKVIFRGTDESKTKSLLMNVELHGPGYLSFQQEKNKLFFHFKEAIKRHYGSDFQDIHLDVAGHSQGGSFSQLFTTEFLKRRSQTAAFDGINQIQMSCLNSPGVPHSVADDANTFLLRQFLTKPLKVKVNYGMVGGDPIQMSGRDMILAKMPYPIVEAQLMKVDCGQEGAWVDDITLEDGFQIWEDFIKLPYKAYLRLNGVHANCNFSAPSPVDKTGEIKEKYPYQFFTNKNAEDISPMIFEIYNKALWTQYFTFPLNALLYYSGTVIAKAAPYLDPLLPTSNLNTCAVHPSVASQQMQPPGILNWFSYNQTPPQKCGFIANCINQELTREEENPSEDSNGLYLS